MVISLLASFMLMVFPVFSNVDDLNATFKKENLNPNELGLCVVSHGKVKWSHRGDAQMTPASLTKILTAIAALKEFSPEQKIKTQIFGEKKPDGEFYDGPIFLKAGGDPSFISENMWVLVNHFTRTGIKKIKGPIYIDDSLFDSELYDSSRQKQRVDRAYDAPVSAASFNWNSVNVYIKPAQKNSLAQVVLDPENNYLKLENKVKTVSGTNHSIQISVQVNQNVERIVVSGSIGENSKEVVKFASIQNPSLWLGGNLISFLKQRNIQIENTQISKQKISKANILLAEVEGWTMFQMIDGLMKYSNNFIAEMLTKLMASENSQGSISSGINKIKEQLKFYGLDPKNYKLENPSGLTQNNKISPCQLALLLDNAKSDFSVGPALMTALPRPGGDGTLKRRLQNASSRVRAKTGLLNGVVGLSGYVSSSSGDIESFAFIYNGPEKRDSDSKELFDKLVLRLAN